MSRCGLLKRFLHTRYPFDHIFFRVIMSVYDRWHDDTVATDFLSGDVSAQELSIFECSGRMPIRPWRGHVQVGAMRWRRLALRCLVHVTRVAWQAVLDSWQQALLSDRADRVHCIHQNSWSVEPGSGASIGSMRKEAWWMWRHL